MDAETAMIVFISYLILGVWGLGTGRYKLYDSYGHAAYTFVFCLLLLVTVIIETWAQAHSFPRDLVYYGYSIYGVVSAVICLLWFLPGLLRLSMVNHFNPLYVALALPFHLLFHVALYPGLYHKFSYYRQSAGFLSFGNKFSLSRLLLGRKNLDAQFDQYADWQMSFERELMAKTVEARSYTWKEGFWWKPGDKVHGYREGDPFAF